LTNTYEDTLDGSDNVTDGSFVIVASHNDPGVQLIPARTDSAPSSHNHIPATRSQTARPSPRHEGEKATHTNELKVAENTRERSTGGGLKGLIAQSHDQGPADAYESRERMMRAGGTHGPALPENDAQAPSDSRSKPDDREYEFVEHPEPRRIQKFREVAAIVREPDGVEHPVKVHFDNCADSNFISSSIVKALRFKERPLPGRDRVTYEALIGEYTPIMYVVLYLRLRGVSEHYRESFRVVESDAFELIVGAATIEKRKIPLQEQTGMSAFPSFKKEPTKGELSPIP
jgi:hypothetical protein